MKRIIRINIIFLLGVLLNSCGSKSDSESLLAHKSGESSKLIVCIQPFGNVTAGYLAYVKNSLQKDFSIVKILPKINLPRTAFVGIRKRYDANKMLWYLQDLYVKRKYPNETFLVGVTESDLCQNRQNPKKWKGKKGFGSPDYRIMGFKMDDGFYAMGTESWAGPDYQTAGIDQAGAQLLVKLAKTVKPDATLNPNNMVNGQPTPIAGKAFQPSKPQQESLDQLDEVVDKVLAKLRSTK